jgi:hypothetical protein
MKAISLGGGLFALCWLPLALASQPVTISDPSPSIDSSYKVGETKTVIYTVTNNVPGQSEPITVTGISVPVSRVAVAHDCGNALPIGPSTCNIGILIAPIISEVGQSINQSLIVNYQGRTPLIKSIAFTVQPAPPPPPPPPPPPQALLTVAKSSVMLAVNGVARVVTITANQGDANDVNYTISPALPAGTVISPETCGNIAAGQKCVLTITPGSVPSADPGLAAAFAELKVSGTNTNTLAVHVSVLTLGNIFQQGYVFALDDMTPAVDGVGGSIIATTDNSAGIQWYNGDNIATGALSTTDGAGNTLTISVAQGVGDYAASYCANYEIDADGHTPCQSGHECYKNWYLPAICQLGPETNDSGCVNGMPNIVENLVKHAIGGFSSVNNYWSSTEFGTSPNAFAWYQFFGEPSSGEGSFHGVGNKYINFFALRCARALTH